MITDRKCFCRLQLKRNFESALAAYWQFAHLHSTIGRARCQIHHHLDDISLRNPVLNEALILARFISSNMTAGIIDDFELIEIQIHKAARSEVLC